MRCTRPATSAAKWPAIATAPFEAGYRFVGRADPGAIGAVRADGQVLNGMHRHGRLSCLNPVATVRVR